jgi:hypothetical protein
MWTIAGFPARAGIDTLGLAMEGESQIRSRQDCERGLRGGEIVGNKRCGAGVVIATKGEAEGTDTTADWAVYSVGRSVFRISATEPW